jgi:hypothetical protein
VVGEVEGKIRKEEQRTKNLENNLGEGEYKNEVSEWRGKEE